MRAHVTLCCDKNIPCNILPDSDLLSIILYDDRAVKDFLEALNKATLFYAKTNQMIFSGKVFYFINFNELTLFHVSETHIDSSMPWI